jgi:hypothetical protein
MEFQGEVLEFRDKNSLIRASEGKEVEFMNIS